MTTIDTAPTAIAGLRYPVEIDGAKDHNALYPKFQRDFAQIAEPLVRNAITPDILKHIARVFLNTAPGHVDYEEIIEQARQLMNSISDEERMLPPSCDQALTAFIKLLESPPSRQLEDFLRGLGRMEADVVCRVENAFPAVSGFARPVTTTGTFLDLASRFGLTGCIDSLVPTANYIAVEESPMAAEFILAYAAFHGVKNLKVIEADFHSLDFAPNSIDTVRCKNGHPHIPEFQAFIRKLCPAIAPGGQIVLQMEHGNPFQLHSAITDNVPLITELVLEQNWSCKLSICKRPVTGERADLLTLDSLILGKPKNNLMAQFLRRINSKRQLDALFSNASRWLSSFEGGDLEIKAFK